MVHRAAVESNSSLMDEPVLIKLYTVSVFHHEDVHEGE